MKPAPRLKSRVYVGNYEGDDEEYQVEDVDVQPNVTMQRCAVPQPEPRLQLPVHEHEYH